MPSNRFFIGQIHATGDTVTLDGADAHKIRNVLRMQSGDQIILCDSAASEFEATITVTDSHVHAKLGRNLAVETPAPQLRITVAQGIPKGQKMDFVVEKLTELGVAAIVPLITERTIADASEAKRERWRRLAKTAAQQTGRRDIPDIADPRTLAQFLANASAYDTVLIPWELADRTPPLRETLPNLMKDAGAIAIVIGPEGGFSHTEVENARTHGAIPISLGTRILRTETAALSLVSILKYLTN